MFARTLAGLFIVVAVITLGYLAVSPITPSAMRTPGAVRRRVAGIMILGNIIAALIYGLLYGFAAGAFN